MEELEITAKSVEQATKKAEESLGLNRDQFETVVVKKGKSRIIGGEDAVIRVKPLDSPEKDKDVVTVATEVLETLLRLMELEGTIKVSAGETPISFDIDGDDLGILIGRQGQTLACLQFVVRLIVAERLKNWLPLNIDICSYKKRRYESLHNLALHLAEQVKLRRRAMALEPMPSDERRIIHLALSDDPDVITQSTGEGNSRKVVILLKQD